MCLWSSWIWRIIRIGIAIWARGCLLIRTGSYWYEFKLFYTCLHLFRRSPPWRSLFYFPPSVLRDLFRLRSSSFLSGPGSSSILWCHLFHFFGGCRPWLDLVRRWFGTGTCLLFLSWWLVDFHFFCRFGRVEKIKQR